MSTRLAEEGRLKALNQRAECRGRRVITGDSAPTKVSSQRVLASLWLMLSSVQKSRFALAEAAPRRLSYRNRTEINRIEPRASVR